MPLNTVIHSKRIHLIDVEQVDPIEAADAVLFVKAEITLCDEEQLVSGEPFVSHEREADVLRAWHWNALPGNCPKKYGVVQHNVSNKSEIERPRLCKKTCPRTPSL